MRAFSDLEKQLIHRMIQLDDKPGSLNVLGNIIDSFYGKSHLPEHCYVSLKSPTDVSIQIRDEALEQNSLDWIRSVDSDISKKLLIVVALFEYLEAQKLVYLVGDLDLQSLGEVGADTEYTRFEFLDDDLKPLIYKYSRKKIFISETLRAFVNNQFKTDEELRHEKEVSVISDQLKFTRIALGIAIVGLLVSILVPILVTSAIDIKNEKIVTELNEKTIFEAEKSLKAALTPLITELVNNQKELEHISNAVKESNSSNSIAMKKTSKVIGEKIDELSQNITKSIEPIERSLTKSHNKKIQPTAKSSS
ncbi:hypothetical protein LG202_01180 [Methylobacillus methanolivorans]